MATSSRLKFQFSILSMLLTVTAVALAIVAATTTSKVWQLQREVTISNSRIQSLETTATRRQEVIQGEFFGLHGEPVLSIDPRIPKSTPRMLRVLNSKGSGQGGFFRWGPPGDRKLEARRVEVDLRLLRSLDNKDYYRLDYSVDAKAAVPADSVSDQQNILLFEYDGKPKLLVSNESIVIAIAPDRESCVNTTVSVYTLEDAEERRHAWLNGPYKPIVQTMFYPQVRSTKERRTNR